MLDFVEVFFSILTIWGVGLGIGAALAMLRSGGSID